jgi:YidC/Oxa1 family membrane protein insertase
VCVRALLVPLTLKQYHSMQALQRLAPEIKTLQEKYKDDKQRLNQEMMKFYQENKVNPFGSCLPLLLQLPVFISLFYMLRKDLKVDICGPESQIAKVAAQMHTTITHVGCNEVVPGSAKFGFIPDLTAPATGWVLVVLLVMYIGLAAGLEPADDGADGRQEPALPHAGAAVRVRPLRADLPGRTAGVLDHDERLDRRPAVHHQELHRAPSSARRAATVGHGREAGGEETGAVRRRRRGEEATAPAGAGRSGRERQHRRPAAAASA